jgi:predicted ATPase
VLDNLEQLVDAAPRMARLLECAPELSVLATSREALGLRIEHRFHVAPLRDESARRLFENRCAARGFALRSEDAPAVAEICRGLEGLPLAIELAAARLGVLDPAGLAARLDDVLGLLGPGPRDVPDRQRTLRATLDWSYGLLSSAECEAFVALGAFAGGCDLTAAEAVTGAPIFVLDALVDKCLVETAGGRLTLLEPVRQYAAERLGDAVRARHFAHYLELAERTRRELWSLGSAAPAFELLQRERDNLRTALAWAIGGAGAVQLVGALDSYWRIAIAEREGIAWCERALGAADDRARPADIARARLVWAHLSPACTPLVLEQAEHKLCPYPREGFARARGELGEAFCHHLAELARKPPPWQPDIPSRELNTFWRAMEERARD